MCLNDILFFVTSSNEAFDYVKGLHTHIKHNMYRIDTKIICNGNIFCVEVYSGMDPYKQ